MFRCDHCGQFAPRKKTTSSRLRFCSKGCEVAAREGQGRLDKHGYRIVTIRGHQIPEHRIVMEGVLGRPLMPYETVHHRNGQRADNRRENLELWDSRNPKGQRVPEKLAWCQAYLEEHGYRVIAPVI